MSTVVYDTVKKTMAKVLSMQGYCEERRSLCSDAAVELEVAHGPDFPGLAQLQEAELKLRAVRELTKQAADHVISAFVLVKGRMPEASSQVELFSETDGTWRVVVTGGQEAPLPEPGPGKAAANNGQLSLEDEALAVEASALAKGLTPPQTGVLDTIARAVGSQPLFEKDFGGAKRKPLNAIKAKGLVIDAGGEVGLSPSEVGYKVIELAGLGVDGADGEGADAGS